MKKVNTILLGLCAVLGAQNAVAAATDNGVYADIGVGYGKVDVPAIKKNHGFTGNAQVGYRFNKHVAVEGGASLYPQIVGTDTYHVHAAVKGMLPVNNNTELFGKVGVAHVTALHNNHVGSTHRVSPYFAAGATYWFNNKFGATLQGEATTRQDFALPRTYGATIGASYKFN